MIHSPAFRRLQGKTQVFPGHESDFFRNRLTHSLEVARIAELIAYRLNRDNSFFRTQNLNPRICAIAGLVHDLGHPPFGHNGEHALDDMMREYGGFEGNAQSLRIVGRLERKVRHQEEGDISSVGDARLGLNLTYRTLASILKYDRVIPHVRDTDERLVKGYYAAEEALVTRIKKAVNPDWEKAGKPFKTVECQIMDLADDIAYSTFDLEDCFKAGFLTPAIILTSESELLKRVAAKVSKEMKESLDEHDVLSTFEEMFSQIGENPSKDIDIIGIVKAFKRSQNLAESGYLRTEFSTELIQRSLAGIRVEIDERCPATSVISLEPGIRRLVEVLKNYVYEATIYSARVKVAEYRGYSVVRSIFDALSGPKGYLLMPDDVRRLHSHFEANASARMRVVCDFIAGMTDNYALEFYGRLSSDSPQSIFKPI